MGMYVFDKEYAVKAGEPDLVLLDCKYCCTRIWEGRATNLDYLVRTASMHDDICGRDRR